MQYAISLLYVTGLNYLVYSLYMGSGIKQQVAAMCACLYNNDNIVKATKQIGHRIIIVPLRLCYMQAFCHSSSHTKSIILLLHNTLYIVTGQPLTTWQLILIVLGSLVIGALSITLCCCCVPHCPCYYSKWNEVLWNHNYNQLTFYRENNNMLKQMYLNKIIYF